MASQDLYNITNLRYGILPELRGDLTENGSISSTQSWESLVYLIVVGTYVQGTITMRLEHSDFSNFSIHESVPAEDLLGDYLVYTGSAARYGIVGYIGNKPYIRPVLVQTGTGGNDAIAGIIGLFGHPHTTTAQP